MSALRVTPVWKRLLGGTAALVAVAALAFGGWRWQRSIPVGGVRVDPLAALRPDRTYRVVVWDTDIPLPWSETPYTQAAREAIEAFQKDHPNVVIDYHLIDQAASESRLESAFEAGTPPDVFGTPGHLALYSPDWQVPMERYLTPEEAADLAPAARQAVAGAQARAVRRPRLWGWPRWVAPVHWIGRSDLLRQFGLEAPAAVTAWNYDQALTVLRAHKAARGARTGGLGVDPASAAVFASLMGAAGFPDLFGPQGEVLWTRDALRPVAQFIGQLAEGDLVASPLQEMARQRIGLLESGRALMIAPVNAWSTHHLFQSFEEAPAAAAPSDGSLDDRAASADYAGWDPGTIALAVQARQLTDQKLAVLPLPAPQAADRGAAAAQAGSNAAVSAYVVFRQRPFPGSDQVRAAMLVAAHLSRQLGPWVAQRLGVVPAFGAALAEWQEKAPLPAAVLQRLADWASRARPRVLARPLQKEADRLLTDVIAPQLLLLWSGQLSPADFVDRVAPELERAGAQRRNSTITQN